MSEIPKCLAFIMGKDGETTHIESSTCFALKTTDCLKAKFGKWGFKEITATGECIIDQLPENSPQPPQS